MVKTIASGIVTYNPDISILVQNIDSLLSQIEKVIIVDNSSRNLNEIKKCLNKFAVERICLIENDKNGGIAKALNQMMRQGKKMGVQWVLTMDQDSIIPENLISEFIKYTFLPNIGIICPRVYDRNSKVTLKNDNCDVEEIERCFTSGSLTNIDVWEKVCGFDEKMFIDYVDHDYCFRLKKNGFKIVRVNTVVMSHALGNIKCLRIGKYKIVIFNHSAERKYYQVRNRYYLSYKYYGKVNKECVYYTIAPIIKILLAENDKLNKIKACIMGVKDGLKMRHDARK